MADVVDDIKSRLGIYELVSQYVQLKKAGQNWKGLCPFHNEKTPSFVVSPEKQIFHCFGCNKGGDIFTFVQEYEGVSFPEAMAVLGDRVGVKILNSRLSAAVAGISGRGNDNGAGKTVKDEYFKAHELACEFFEKKLFESNDGRKVLEYLKRRGLCDATIREFRLGFAPDSFEELYPILLKKGVKKNVLLESGLASSKGIGSDSIYDKYRARLMFPIFDYLGRICGFGGRTLKQEQSPKYLNSPENLIYSKSRLLYGLSHAKQAIKGADFVVVVEGYFDVILPHQAGVKNVIASSGTALTSAQTRLIKRLTTNVVMCFDNDEAGFEASKRAYFLCQQEDMNVKIVNKFEGKDPADFVKGGGDFGGVVGKAVDFVNFYIDELISRNDISNFEGRRGVVKEILPVYKQMSVSMQDFYIPEFARKINISEKAFYDEINSYRLPIDHPAREDGLDKCEAVSAKIELQDIIIAFLLKYPYLFGEAGDKLDVNFFDEERKNIYNELLNQYNSLRSGFCEWNFGKGFLSGVKGKLDVLILYVEDNYCEFGEEILKDEFYKLIDRLRINIRKKKLGEIEKAVSEAEACGDKKKLKELLFEQQELLST